MYTVYILRDKTGKFYKGMTNNIVRRLKEHRLGKTITTSKMEMLECSLQGRIQRFLQSKSEKKVF